VPEVVVGITNFVLTMHQTHGYFPRAESAVISNSFRPPSQAPRTHTQHPRTPLRIGFIGRFHPTKGVELLLRALKGLPVGSYVAKLAGTGSPDYEARLRSLARGLAIAFLGWVPREEFYEQIDVLVVPSLYCEPQGMVLIEAASLGVPVIYSDRGGLGETGAAFPGFRSFDPSRPERLAEVLLPLIECPSAVNSLQESIGAVPASFEIDGIVGEYQQLYESVRAGRTAS
jgi:glycosyltransferase involved in cell wall biosynthesis